MSTRATIKITDGKDTLWVYHHYDGGPECIGVDLTKYLSSIKYAWSGDEIATDLVKGKKCGKMHIYELWECRGEKLIEDVECPTCGAKMDMKNIVLAGKDFNSFKRY